MFEPKPMQKPHPPIYIGGESEAALQRVVHHGQGWFGVQHTPDSIAAVMAQLKLLCKKENKDFDSLHILTQAQCKSKARASGAGMGRNVLFPNPNDAPGAAARAGYFIPVSRA